MRSALRAGAFLTAGALLLVGCDNDDEPEDPDEEEVEEAGPDEPPTFTRVEIDGLGGEVGEVEIHDVHGDGAGWIAVGATTEPGQEPRASALVSEDGEEFEPLEVPLPETARHRASAVTRLDDAVVVVGTATEGDETHLVVWTGTDEGWELTEHADDLGAWPGLAVNNAEAAGDHAVVVGTVLDEDDARRPAAWTVTAEGDVATSEVELEEGFLRDVAGDEDLLLAAGGQQEGGAFVLRSEDAGASWEPSDIDGLDGEVQVLEADGDGWLAGGRVPADSSGGAAVWSSGDGESWELLNDPERSGPSSVRAVHRLEGRLVALGTWLHVEEEGDDEDEGGLNLFGDDGDGWSEPEWPGPGERGWFGVGAEHDGRVVVVGGVHDAVTSLRTATSPDEWDRVPVAEQLLEQTEGVLSRWIASLASDGEVLVGVGGELVLEEDIATRGVFAGLAPAFEPADEPARGAGQLRSVIHDADRGFVAVGSLASAEFDHAGARALVSEDGREWSELEVGQTGDDDRAQVVLPLDGRILVAGLTWEDEEPVSYLWDLVDDELERLEVPDLDGFGVVDGCAGGDLAALVVFPGDATRLLAVSQDGGESFSLAGDAPLTAASDLACAVNDRGELLVAAQGGAGATLYHFDAEGDFEQVDVELGDGAAVAAVRHLPEVGWVVLSTFPEDGARSGRVHLSRDLEQWTTGGLETEAETTDVHDAAVAGGALYLLGSEDDTAAMWQLDLEDLGVAGGAQTPDADEAEQSD